MGRLSTTPGSEGVQHRTDLLTAIAHEIGHEHEHDGGVQEALSTGEQLTLHGVNVNDYFWLINLPDLTKKRDPVRLMAVICPLTFAPGETTKTITIEVKGDSKREGNETFSLDLFGNSSNSPYTKTRGLATILNDD